MGNPKFIPMVIGNDGETPDLYEQSRIEQGSCINCKEFFNPNRAVVYARTRESVIWWHKENCARSR